MEMFKDLIKNLKNISIIKLSNSKIVDFYKRGKWKYIEKINDGNV